MENENHGGYWMDAMFRARGNHHTMDFVATSKFSVYSVDKYLCSCGAEVQIASTPKIGCWMNERAARSH